MKKYFMVIVFSCVVSSSVMASELVYTPINPSFGGNPLNGNFLLGKAQSQNKHKAPVVRKSYAEKFQESLERAYISKLVREITDVAFNEACDVAVDPSCEPSLFAEDSIFVSGQYEIQVLTSGSDSITVQITHLETGEITIIEVPRFG
ncbi:curli assembly protein CsgF [Cognaticolwellia mytili]|uniref:curli assembly protein CsgF n=1 Tax=Cognaticolwellia mytili TaxID=1888913 RepID=UPI001F230BBE|nr:curli assembly protein CsgF [Cognaticolwellia mytili]